MKINTRIPNPESRDRRRSRGFTLIELLLVLVPHRDRVVGKHELFDRVWPRMVVEAGDVVAAAGARNRSGSPSSRSFR